MVQRMVPVQHDPLDRSDPSPAALPLLVVDDEQPILELVRDLLEEAGYEVLIAMSGEQALALAHATPLALVLTDLMLPRMDGEALCLQLHADPQTADLPIILLTAAFRPRLHASFAAVLPKPFAVADLLAVVARHQRQTAPPVPQSARTIE
jgi:CheY-like chemotaxis protein